MGLWEVAEQEPWPPAKPPPLCVHYWTRIENHLWLNYYDAQYLLIVFRKLEPPSVKTAPPVKLAHGPEGRRNTEEATCTNQMDNTQKNAWGPIFQNREHFVDLHVCWKVEVFKLLCILYIYVKSKEVIYMNYGWQVQTCQPLRDVKGIKQQIFEGNQ